MKVLIVDKDKRFAEQTSRYLEARAHLVVHQTNPAEAMARANHWQPELVMLSAEAALSGLTEQIAAMKPRPAMILTGMLDEYPKVWKAWQKGGDDVLIKPVLKGQELQTAIVTAMENAAAGSRSFARSTRASA